MKKYPSVAIVFPVRNGWPETEKCLKSIKELNYPAEKIEVIIVDNGSKEDLKSQIHISNFKTIFNKKNLGFAKAINQGVKKARSELILITNNDVVFEKDCLKELVKTLTGNSNIGAAGGKIYRKKKNHLDLNGFRLNPYLAYHQYDLIGINQQQETDWLPGTCILTRKDLFTNLGGLDAGYFFFFEDVDFCLRLKKAGFRILYNPKAILIHNFSRTIYRENTRRILHLAYLSRWRCIFKNASLIQIITSTTFLLTVVSCYQTWKTRYNVFPVMLEALRPNLKLLINRLKSQPVPSKTPHPFPSQTVIKIAKENLFPGAKILDVGCHDGQTGAQIKKAVPCQVWGIDLDQKAIRKADCVLDKTILADITKPELPLPAKYFDLIIMSNILEHLPDPLAVLTGFKRFLKKDGLFLIAVPNVAFYPVRLNLLRGRFEYQENGILDYGHLHFFTLKSFNELIQKAGFDIKKITTNNLGWRGVVDKLWPTYLASQFIALCSSKKN